MKRSELEAIIVEEIHTYLEYFSQLNERKNASPSKDEAPDAQASPTKGAPDKKEKKDKPEWKYDAKKGNQKRERRNKEAPPKKRKRGTNRFGDYDSAGTVPTIRGRTMGGDDKKKKAELVKKRAELGQYLLDKLERGKRANSEFYQRVLAHAKRKLNKKEDEKVSKRELFSFVWAIATDMVLKGVTTDKEGRAKLKKAKADKNKAQDVMAKKITGGDKTSKKKENPDQLGLKVKGSSKENPARKKKDSKPNTEKPSSSGDSTDQLDLFK